MLPTRLLIANRGEIAIRLIRAAAELGIETVAIHTDDDAGALHTRKADDVRSIGGHGPRGYLDGAKIIAVAKAAGCDAVHPGYGFLSENAQFASDCERAGLRFVGPRPEILELFGDKASARAVAEKAEVPVLRGTDHAVSLAQARDFFTALCGGAMAIKAVAGGGGRGIRIVRTLDEIDDAYARCASEALAAFGCGDVYVEQFLPQARHIEIQILGDGSGAVTHLGERDCSIQRRHQKVVEIAPAPNFPPKLRHRIIDAALKLARTVRYDNIGTFEFLVDASNLDDDSAFAFMEANPRLQVEHTITEEISGVDLVVAQLRLAGGESLAALGIDGDRDIRPGASAMQVRINMESVNPDGSAVPAAGTLSAFEMPSGKGIRIDGYGYVGYRSNPSFDSLLAKLIAVRTQGSFAELAAKIYRALGECRIEGIATNIGFLQDLLLAPDFIAGRFTTDFVDRWASKHAVSEAEHPRRYFEHAKASDDAAHHVQQQTPEGLTAVIAPMLGSVVAVTVKEYETVAPGQLLAVIEAMKMEHEVHATTPAIVRQILIAAGDPVQLDDAMFFVEETAASGTAALVSTAVEPDHIRDDLKQVLERQRRARDESRPDAVAKRHAMGMRTARENVDDLCDAGTFVEYGALTVANQRSRRSLEELIDKSPADGMVTGIGAINGELFGDPVSRCAVLAYDYTVFAGTQGNRNHLKTDRLVHIARKGKLPLVLFAEGGGGRPGEDSGDYGDTFAIFAQLSGLVPMVGIVAGRCYAGNAALLGVCDVIIATRDSNIGMGGPAMIEGGGLGVFKPEDIGPIDVQTRNGVVDIAVQDEAEAVAVAKKYLAFFQSTKSQGRLDDWEIHDQRELRHVVPENRLRAYDIRRVIELIADIDSTLELRRDFGKTIITTLARIEGRAIGIVANNPAVLGGAIDSDGADKAARFMQLCDAFDLPILNLCDTPGIMVGPDAEKTALVRHSSRMFLVGTNVTVPNFTIVVRKVYGLGGIAMTGGALRYNTFTVGWPTGEFGPMGLEGAVRLGYRNELDAIEDPIARKKTFDDMVEQQYQRGKALKLSNSFGIDDCIDPADSRFWIANILASLRPPAPRDGKKRPFIDAW